MKLVLVCFLNYLLHTQCVSFAIGSFDGYGQPAGRGLTACKIGDLGRKIEKKRDFANCLLGHRFRTIFLFVDSDEK